jgi:hypothetical protein
VAKYLVLVVVTAFVSAAAYFGWSRYQSAMNTHERVMEAFATSLAQDQDGSSKSYQRLSERLKQQYTPDQWRNKTALFHGSSAPQLESHETVADTFNVYPADSDPQRYVYKYRIKGKDYALSAVLYKQGNSWLIDEFQGDYK